MPPNKTCVNCGAPLTGCACEYCGTVYEPDRSSAEREQLMAEMQKTLLEIRISRQLEEMNSFLEEKPPKGFIDRLLRRGTP